MQEKVESGMAITPPDSTVMLGLSPWRSRGGPGYDALLEILPFLALGRPGRSRAEALIRSQGNLSTLPWPGLKWFGWPAQASPALRAAEAGLGQGGDRAADTPLPATDSSPTQDRATLPALSLMLPQAGQRSSGSSPVQSTGPALTGQPLARLTPAISGPLIPVRSRPAVTSDSTRLNRPRMSAPLASTAGLVNRESRPQRLPAEVAGSLVSELRSERLPAEQAGPGTESLAGSQAGRIEASPVDEGSRPEPSSISAGPHQRLLNVLPGLAFGTASPPASTGGDQPAISAQKIGSETAQGVAPLGLPWPHQRRKDALEREVGPAPSGRTVADNLPSLPESGLREPGPYAATPLQTLSVVVDEIKQLVERRVKKEMQIQQEESQARTPIPNEAESRPPAIDVASDEVARRLLQKMQILAQEEQFRQGRLR